MAQRAEPIKKRRRFRNPVDRLTQNLPRPWRVAIDWIVTIAGAIAIVLAIKAWVVNPYRIPSSSMEPTLHCARPAPGCLAHFSDRVLANRFIYRFRNPHRGEIIVFTTPGAVCGSTNPHDTFVKRLIGLPGDHIEERLLHGKGYIFVNGARLKEPYIKPDRRDARIFTMTNTPTTPNGRLGKNEYFFMGDNRAASCDSRDWGPVPRKNLIGEVFAVYWPPNRIGFR
jgi:signal peptidase I